jgi:hypothetical protein
VLIELQEQFALVEQPESAAESQSVLELQEQPALEQLESAAESQSVLERLAAEFVP